VNTGLGLFSKVKPTLKDLESTGLAKAAKVPEKDSVEPEGKYIDWPWLKYNDCNRNDQRIDVAL
jgi:hypothetical protein